MKFLKKKNMAEIKEFKPESGNKNFANAHKDLKKKKIGRTSLWFFNISCVFFRKN